MLIHGGHGRSWMVLPEETIAGIARRCDTKGVYTNLRLPHGVVLQPDGTAPIERVTMPRGQQWRSAARPGGHAHITIEEAEATVWSLESRLHRSNEQCSRVAHGGDNIPAVCAFRRGRSSSFALNLKCRKAMAIQIVGRLMNYAVQITITI